MSYNSNGFNYQGTSLTSIYNTNLAGKYSTKTSGFTQLSGTNSVDIATLISPAVDGATGTKTGSTYTGFSNKMNFDTAFSSNTIPNATITQTNGAYTNYGSTWKRITHTSNGSIRISYPYTYTTGAANVASEIVNNVSGHIMLTGGGGGGANTNGRSSGGGGGGCVCKFTYTINRGTTLYTSIGGGGTGAAGNSNKVGNQGGTTQLYGNTNYDLHLQVYGGGGGGPQQNSGSRNSGASGSTGGPGAHDNINSAQNPLSLGTKGHVITRTGTGAAAMYGEYRNIGGKDTGYGYGAGGGGGAGGVGQNHHGAYNRDGGDGGPGVDIWGRVVGGGGGGGPDHGASGANGDGGSGGGGASQTNKDGTSGTNGYGGGGGAARGTRKAGNGGSGCTVILFPKSGYTFK